MKIIILAPDSHFSKESAPIGFHTGSEIAPKVNIETPMWKGTSKFLTAIYESQDTAPKREQLQKVDYFFVFKRGDDRNPDIWYSRTSKLLEILSDAEINSTPYDIIISYHAMEQKEKEEKGNGFGASLKARPREDWSLAPSKKGKFDIWKLKHVEKEYVIFDCLNPASQGKRKEDDYIFMKEISDLIHKAI